MPVLIVPAFIFFNWKREKRIEYPSKAMIQKNIDPEKQRILEAAERWFMRHGFQRVSMDELAADLGMSKKTIYKHFPSKEKLMTEIVRQMLRTAEQRVAAIVQTERPALERLTSLVTLVGIHYVRLSKQLRFDLVRYAPALWKEIETFRRLQARTKIFPVLIQAKEEGILRADVNVDLFFLILLTAVEGIINPTTLSQQPFSAEEAFRGIFRTLLQGGLTEEAARKLEHELPMEFTTESSRIV